MLEKAKKILRESEEKFAAKEHSLNTEWAEKIKKIEDQKNKIDRDVKRQNKLKDDQLDALKVAVNHLRRDLNDFRDRENQLKVDNKKLQSEIDFLKATEKGLENYPLGFFFLFWSM